MFVRPSILAAVAGAVLLSACAPAEVVSAPVETATTPAATPTPAPGENASPAAPQPRAVRIRAAVSDRALAGATLTVRRADTLAVVADGLKLDAEGALTFPIDDRLPAGTAVIVQAAGANSAALSGIFVITDAAYAVQQATGSEWLIDLASSIATRKLASKFADVFGSLPANSPFERYRALVAQFDGLVGQTRSLLASPLTDSLAADALRQAAAQPNKDTLETLANALIRRTELQRGFVDLVTACNRQAIANMLAGGPLVMPANWQVYEVYVPAVFIWASGPGEIVFTFGNERFQLPVTDAAQRLAEATQRQTDAARNPDFAAINTNVVTGGSSGGGGVSRPPSLQGTITVGGVARGGAVVQLNQPDGTLVASTVSAASGAYSFYDVPDGSYHLTVAVDGAVQSTRTITIGPAI